MIRASRRFDKLVSNLLKLKDMLPKAPPAQRLRIIQQIGKGISIMDKIVLDAKGFIISFYPTETIKELRNLVSDKYKHVAFFQTEKEKKESKEEVKVTECRL
jgi:hypothetical protein